MYVMKIEYVLEDTPCAVTAIRAAMNRRTKNCVFECVAVVLPCQFTVNVSCV